MELLLSQSPEVLHETVHRLMCLISISQTQIMMASGDWTPPNPFFSFPVLTARKGLRHLNSSIAGVFNAEVPLLDNTDRKCNNKTRRGCGVFAKLSLELLSLRNASVLLQRFLLKFYHLKYFYTQKGNFSFQILYLSNDNHLLGNWS